MMKSFQDILNTPIEIAGGKKGISILSKIRKDKKILGPMPDLKEYEIAKAKCRSMAFIPELRFCFEEPVLSFDQHYHQFRKMNYLKYLASTKIKKINKECPPPEEIKNIENLLNSAHEIRQQLICANMRLVVFESKKNKFYRQQMSALGASSLDMLLDLVSHANLSLFRCVDKFEYYRGFCFSTYVTWAIINSLSRYNELYKREEDRVYTNQDNLIFEIAEKRFDEESHKENQKLVKSLISHAPEREKMALTEYYLKESTLKDVGLAIDVTKERVRQLCESGLRRIREKCLLKNS